LSHERAGQTPIGQSANEPTTSPKEIYTTFEGASEIQRLVNSRAISGMRIR
jgi:hypothetical protein